VPKKIKLGDVFEVATSIGLGYIQCIYSDQNWGECVRVFEKTHFTRVNDVDFFATQHQLFITFIPLKYMIRHRLAIHVGNADVPEKSRRLPLFRTGLVDVNGDIKTWWLRNVETGHEEKYGSLSKEILSLPISGIWTYRLLVLGIEQGYKSENDPKGWGPKVPPEYQ
jgi:hypothetical protein